MRRNSKRVQPLDERTRFEIFLRQHQQARDVSLVKELIGCALENGHEFEGWSNEEIVNDMLAYADFDIEKHIGPVAEPVTKTRLLVAVNAIKDEIH